MQNHIKERVLGSTILLGGGVLLSAMLFRTNEIPKSPTETIVVTDEQIKENSRSSAEELTVDFKTEQKILAKKRELRAKKIAAREAEINKLLEAQDKARLAALKKAEKENGIKATVTLKPEFTDAQLKEKATKEAAQRAQTKKLLAQAQAESEKLKALQREKAALEEKQRLDDKKQEQSRAQQKKREAEKLKQEIAKKQTKESQTQKTEQNYVAARNQLKQARKNSTDTTNYAVQVALASDQARADDMANNLRKYGYKVTTSTTTRGVRVVVGPEKGQSAAYALREKLKSDKRVNINDGWVTAYNRVHSKAKKPLDTKKTSKSKTDNNIKTKEKAQSSQGNNQTKNQTAKQNQEAKLDKYAYGVQVAMAGDAQSRDNLISKLKKNGYRVKTSNTSRGTRIIVGGGLTRSEARKLQAKVNADKRIGISGAWIKRERKRN